MTSRPLLRGWSHTHTHTHTHTHSLTHSLTHTLTHSLTHPVPHSSHWPHTSLCSLPFTWILSYLSHYHEMRAGPPPCLPATGATPHHHLPKKKIPLEWPSLCLPFPLQLQLPQSSRVPSGLGEGARSGETISPASPALSRPRSEMKVVTQGHGSLL